jgi:hypothetical protein
LTNETRSPRERLETRLALRAAFLVVPIFALANAGVPVSAPALGDAVSSPVTAGVALGLVLGNPAGIAPVTLIAARANIGGLPPRTGWGHVLGLGTTAGIGFAMALFVIGLSFDDPALAGRRQGRQLRRKHRRRHPRPDGAAMGVYLGRGRRRPDHGDADLTRPDHGHADLSPARPRPHTGRGSGPSGRPSPTAVSGSRARLRVVTRRRRRTPRPRTRRGW